MTMTLPLERAFPTSHGVELSQLQSSLLPDGVVDFPVDGTYDPFLVGLYFTRVQLGSPPKEFYVQIDTGSDVLPRCDLGEQSSDSGCSTQNQCSYTFQYGDGSGTSDGTYVTSAACQCLTLLLLGFCLTQMWHHRLSDLTKPDRAIDGIFSLGSRACQLLHNTSPKSIALNGPGVGCSPQVFETSSNRGTIVDSGTTLSYLAEEAYEIFVNAINQAVSQNVRPLVTRGNQCYLTTSRSGALSGAWAFRKFRARLTILGGQRIGWANYDWHRSYRFVDLILLTKFSTAQHTAYSFLKLQTVE
ncbi:hypothetical protein HAX54_041174 [Datura stramonium]|uniref:Xylanase inhibitor C-terminal domain-containing protein n=1 Tax=Datura stramonium TaxID=4076 RepID=A0ABS8VSG2_DATST|nr:hypothetical protein [Datura stramonium]